MGICIIFSIVIVIVLIGSASKEYDSKIAELDNKFGSLTKEFQLGFLDVDKTIRIYAASSKVWLMGRAYDFDNIIGVSMESLAKTKSGRVVAKTKVSTLGTIGRSAVGKMLSGDTGALIGAGTATKTTTTEKEEDEVTYTYLIDIKTDDLQKPVVSLTIENDRAKAMEILSTFEIIVKNNKHSVSE